MFFTISPPLNILTREVHSTWTLNHFSIISETSLYWNKQPSKSDLNGVMYFIAFIWFSCIICSSSFSWISVMLPPSIHDCSTCFVDLISSYASRQNAITPSKSFANFSCLSTDSVIPSISVSNLKRLISRSWLNVNTSLLNRIIFYVSLLISSQCLSFINFFEFFDKGHKLSCCLLSIWVLCNHPSFENSRKSSVVSSESFNCLNHIIDFIWNLKSRDWSPTSNNFNDFAVKIVSLSRSSISLAVSSRAG